MVPYCTSVPQRTMSAQATIKETINKAAYWLRSSGLLNDGDYICWLHGLMHLQSFRCPADWPDCLLEVLPFRCYVKQIFCQHFQVKSLPSRLLQRLCLVIRLWTWKICEWNIWEKGDSDPTEAGTAGFAAGNTKLDNEYNHQANKRCRIFGLKCRFKPVLFFGYHRQSSLLCYAGQLPGIANALRPRYLSTDWPPRLSSPPMVRQASPW